MIKCGDKLVHENVLCIRIHNHHGSHWSPPGFAWSIAHDPTDGDPYQLYSSKCKRPKELLPLEQRIKNFRDKIPMFNGRPACMRGIGEEFGELCEAALIDKSDEFYKEAADIVFVVTGMLAAEGQSLDYWLRLKVIRAENNVNLIIKKQTAKQRGVE